MSSVKVVAILSRGRVNSLSPRQNRCHFPDDTFKCIFLNENVWILIKISLKFVPKGPINNIPGLVQIMAWHRPGDKPLSEPMMVSLQTHICVTRPQWVKLLVFPSLILLWCHIIVMASQITGNWAVCSTECPGYQQRTYQSSALLALCEGNPLVLVDSPHKGPVIWNNFSMLCRGHATP